MTNGVLCGFGVVSEKSRTSNKKHKIYQTYRTEICRENKPKKTSTVNGSARVHITCEPMFSVSHHETAQRKFVLICLNKPLNIPVQNTMVVKALPRSAGNFVNSFTWEKIPQPLVTYQVQAQRITSGGVFLGKSFVPGMWFVVVGCTCVVVPTK